VNPRRTRLLFLALVVGQLFLLASRVRDPDAPPSLLERTFLRFTAPLGGLVAAAGGAVAEAHAARRSRAELEAENRALREEVVELRRLRLRLSGLALEAEELARGSGLTVGSGFVLRPARVVYFDRDSQLRTLLLDVGARGARRDQAVLAETGVIGRIVEVSGRWAKVQLLTDRAAAAAVLLEDARRQGVLRGAGPGRLELDYVPRQVEVAVGERLVTAGIDGVYPRGLPVGVVTAVEPGSEMFHHITIAPAADFSNLGPVFLLEREQPPTELIDRESRGGR